MPLRQLISVMVLFGLSSALAVPRTAADWFALARQRQGGAALDHLKTLHQVTVLETPKASNGTAASPAPSTAESWIDFDHGYIKDVLSQGGKVLSMKVRNASGSFYYVPEAGRVPLPLAEREDFERDLSRGNLALRFPFASWDGAELLGPQTWQGIKGTALSLTRNGLTDTLLLADDGTILGERAQTMDVGEVTLLASDFRKINGLLIPMTEDGYLEPDIHFVVERLQNLEVNLTLAPAVFEVPK